MDIELLKAKLYLVELRLQQDQARHPVGTKDPVSGEGIGGQYKLVNKTGSAASKLLKDASTAVKNVGESTVKTATEAKKEIQDFVESIFSKENLAKLQKFDPTPEARKAIGEAFNDVGRKINPGVRKSVTDAIDNVKKFNVKDLIDHTVDNLKKFGEDNQTQIAVSVGIVFSVAITGMGLSSVAGGVAAIAGGKVAIGLAKCVGGLVWTFLGALVVPSSLGREILSSQGSNPKTQENQEKVKSAISEPTPKIMSDEDIYTATSALILETLGADTEPSKSFKEKYRKENGQEYKKETDREVRELENEIVDLMTHYLEKLADYKAKGYLDGIPGLEPIDLDKPASKQFEDEMEKYISKQEDMIQKQDEKIRHLDELVEIQDTIESAIETRQQYYEDK